MYIILVKEPDKAKYLTRLSLIACILSEDKLARTKLYLSIMSNS